MKSRQEKMLKIVFKIQNGWWWKKWGALLSPLHSILIHILRNKKKSFNLILFEQKEKRDKDNANKARKYHKMRREEGEKKY